MYYRNIAYNVDCANHDTCSDSTVKVDGLGGVLNASYEYSQNVVHRTTAVTATECACDLKQHGRVSGPVAPVAGAV